MATLKDIGAALNLSPATVSRALNGFPEVNAKTRARVIECARALKYRPNQIAKKLVSGRSGMVGMVLKPESDTANDPVFYQIMFGLSDQLAQRDIDLVFHAATASDLVLPYKRLVEKNTLDGFILNAPEQHDPRIAYLQQMDVPFVVHGQTEAADYAYFDIDNAAAARDAANLLVDLGHRRIALLNGPETYAFSQARLRGFRKVAGGRGIDLPDFAIRHGQMTEDYGYGATLSLLSGQEGAAPSAIICASTLVASGVYRAAADLGLAIPGDLSVVAHDDAVPQMRAANFNPSLTVTRAPLRDACAPLAQGICDLLDGKPAGQLQILAQSELIIRTSTKAADMSGKQSW